MTMDVHFSENDQTFSAGFEKITPVQGATFTPSVSDDGVISWTNDHNLPNPAPVNIKGEKGDSGEKGDTGSAGRDGKDGFSPVVEVSTVADGSHAVTITDENGTHYFDVENGFSPTIETQYMPPDITGSSGYYLNITDKNGTQRIYIENGTDGYTPVKGIDYWTEADKAEILAETEEDWQLLADVTTTEEIINFAIDKDMNGNPFSCRKIAAEIVLPQAMTGRAQMFFGNATELWGGTPYMGINCTFTDDIKPTYFDLRIELMKNKFAVLGINSRAGEYFASSHGADQVIRHRGVDNVSALTKFFFCNALTAYPFPAGTRILVWGCKA